MSQESLDKAGTQIGTDAARAHSGGGSPAPKAQDGRTYTSTGTINVQVSVEKTDVTICFIPDSHHVVQHGRKSYAVFVSCNGNACAVLRDLEKCCMKCKPSKLRLTAMLGSLGSAVMSAAVNQCKVDIKIEEDGPDLMLTEITIPAKRDK